MPAVLLKQNETRLLDKSDGRLEGFGVEAYLCDPADSAHCFVPGYDWMSDVYLHQQKSVALHSPYLFNTLSHTHSFTLYSMASNVLTSVDWPQTSPLRERGLVAVV